MEAIEILPMSAATNSEGSGLAISDSACEHIEVREATPRKSTGMRHLLFFTFPPAIAILSYWIAWVAFAVCALRFSDQYDRSNGWWMALAVFWCTSSAAAPSRLNRTGLRFVASALATLTAAFLIYGTFEWSADILDGWSIGPPGQWLRLLALPLGAIAASMVTAIILVPPLRGVFLVHARIPWVISALPTGLANFGASLVSVSRWHTHWKANGIELFIFMILPLILIAMDERIAAYKWSGTRVTAAIGRVWSGEVPVWLALLIVYPLTLGGAIWARFAYIELPREGLSSWKYDNLEALTWVALVLILVAGSTITVRCLNRNADRWPRRVRCLRALVLLVAAPILIATLAGRGFAVGNVFNNSVKTALGSAYDFRLRAQGTELELSGHVTYRLADRLAEQLRIHPGIQRIRLNNKGGFMDEAFYAAQIIAANKLDTVISEECVSSCSLMFVAGLHRAMEKDAQLGFHAARDSDPFLSAKGSMSAALQALGVEHSFAAQVEAISPPTVWYPTREELLAAHILTAAVNQLVTTRERIPIAT